MNALEKLAAKKKFLDRLRSLAKELKAGFTEEGGFPAGELVHRVRTRGQDFSVRDLKESTISDPMRARFARIAKAVKPSGKKKVAGRLGAGIGAVLGGTAGQIAGSATGNLGGILLSRAAGAGLGAALGASKGRRVRSGLAASLLAHTGNLPPALAAALVHGKKRGRITDRISSGLGEARDAFGRDRGAVGRLKKKISDLLSGGKGTPQRAV